MAEKNIVWTKHDANAAQDLKTVALRGAYGTAGYGCYWLIVEYLMSQPGYTLDLSPKYAYVAIADLLKMTTTETKDFIADCINEFDLFKMDGDMLYCPSLLRRLEEYQKKRESYQQRGAQGGKKKAENNKECSKDVAKLNDIVAKLHPNVAQLRKIVANPTYKIRLDKIRLDKTLKEAKASPAFAKPGNSKDDLQKDLKAEYKAMVKDAKHLNDFIRDKRPTFIEPYVELWNLFATKASMPKVQSLSDSRKKKFRIRIQEPPFDFRAILKKANDSEMIRSGNWFTFDWILENQDNYLKTLEGKYDNKTAQQHGSSREQLSAATEELIRRLEQQKHNGTD